MKKCRVCGQAKPLEDFHRQVGAKDGRQNRCKACACALARQWHYDNPRDDALPTSAQKVCTKCGEEKSIIDFYRRRASVDGLMTRCKSCDGKRRRAGKPAVIISKVSLDKKKCNTTVGNAVRDKRLEKAIRCERCGGSEYIEGHHGDYSKPLEVEWLCRKCHGAEHYPRDDMAHLLNT